MMVMIFRRYNLDDKMTFLIKPFANIIDDISLDEKDLWRIFSFFQTKFVFTFLIVNIFKIITENMHYQVTFHYQVYITLDAYSKWFFHQHFSYGSYKKHIYRICITTKFSIIFDESSHFIIHLSLYHLSKGIKDSS